jgi:hypothetical protein
MQTTSDIHSTTAAGTTVAASLRRALRAVLVAALIVAALGGWYAIIGVGIGSLR